MEFGNLMTARYSCRRYEDRPVDADLIEEVLEAGRLAPTAANRQAIRFVVTRDPELRSRLKEAYPRNWFHSAPVIISACGVPAENWVRADGKNYNDVDVAIAMDHVILRAADLGLGTCWIADFDPEAIRRVLNLPPGVEPVVLSPLGYPADSNKTKRRRPLEELVIWERFGAEP